MNREMTKRDLRQLVSRALAVTSGNYPDVVRLFGMPDQDYRRMLNFLVKHDCAVDYWPFRLSRQPMVPMRPSDDRRRRPSAGRRRGLSADHGAPVQTGVQRRREPHRVDRQAAVIPSSRLCMNRSLHRSPATRESARG